MVLKGKTFSGKSGGAPSRKGKVKKFDGSKNVSAGKTLMSLETNR